ncbi:GNAT family N-acetyltransferase [Neobittarella massiliensis]|uniref:GNAT family N-acetyltransferase n=1 Tax=Neobittarella massiliensis (ex Bilen et al. 2018) TaxID=2041842 RepID=UPI000CF61508|nr:GNAT family N-acetyltransferase [Neobittarella massiliensis]
MGFITVDQHNIDTEHICCAIADKKGEHCVSSKKMWMKQRFADGLTFVKLDQRGKVFIEYLPAQSAWYPIQASGYMHIDCLWVAGKFKGQGYASELLDRCIADAEQRGFCGLTVLSSAKKRPFLSDPGYLKHRGFAVADTAQPYFQLWYLPFTSSAPVPQFRSCARSGQIKEQGLVLYYTNQCPHTEKYAPLICQLAADHGLQLSLRKLQTTRQAQAAPTASPTYSLFYGGHLVTSEILSPAKFEKFLQKQGLIPL